MKKRRKLVPTFQNHGWCRSIGDDEEPHIIHDRGGLLDRPSWYYHIIDDTEQEAWIDLTCSMRDIPKLKNAIVNAYYCAMPGPPHWEGAEGGCLGLPKDVAKMILKWL